MQPLAALKAIEGVGVLSSVKNRGHRGRIDIDCIYFKPPLRYTKLTFSKDIVDQISCLFVPLFSPILFSKASTEQGRETMNGSLHCRQFRFWFISDLICLSIKISVKKAFMV